MSRARRLHVPGGTYYVVQHGNVRQPLFAQPDDYGLFQKLLITTLSQTHSRILAYCWAPLALHLVAQIQDVPIGILMQRLTHLFARSMHKRYGGYGHYFPERYRALLLDPDTYLLRLIRYIHYLPRLDGAANHYRSALTSDAVYMRRASAPWLTKRTALKLLSGDQSSDGYATLMSQAPPPQDIELFRRVGSNSLRAIGSAQFLAGLPHHARIHRTQTSLDQIIRTVTRMLEVDIAGVMSGARQRRLTIARAMIAWHASERRVASLTAVAHRLHRRPSTLSHGINRYRTRHPELFELSALRDIVPLGGIDALDPSNDEPRRAAQDDA